MYNRNILWWRDFIISITGHYSNKQEESESNSTTALSILGINPIPTSSERHVTGATESSPTSKKTFQKELWQEMSPSPGISFLLLLLSLNRTICTGLSQILFENFIQDVMESQENVRCDFSYVSDQVNKKMTKSLFELSLNQRYFQDYFM